MQSSLKLSLASRMVTAAKLEKKKKKKNEMADTVHALILMQMESQANGAETHQHPHKQHQWLQGCAPMLLASGCGDYSK